jgi:MoxR-like ATPase
MFAFFSFMPILSSRKRERSRGIRPSLHNHTHPYRLIIEKVTSLYRVTPRNHLMPQRSTIHQLQSHMEEQVVGQNRLIRRLLVALLAGGHLLVEGAPGLAKTRAVKALAGGLEADFHRIQFTPDLLPADLTGSDVFRPEDGSFQFQQGPLFHNLILADEVNRAPAKVQSALLEAMGEGQITVGAKTYRLPELFLVLATQNNIEQEGTYPLPEDQMDRFMFHVNVDYPSPEASREILRINRKEALGRGSMSPAAQRLRQSDVFAARREIMELHLAQRVEEYIIELIEATRTPSRYNAEVADWIRWGASPRGAMAIEQGARVQAWLAERDFVTPEDVCDIAPDALRHRILLDFGAEAEGITTSQCIDRLLHLVPSP